tara:strand:+ start:150 stop:821 length:672 start_codon:yes stop_codon:yes gene_type:complete
MEKLNQQEERYYQRLKKDIKGNSKKFSDKNDKLKIITIRKPISVSIQEEAFLKLKILARSAKLKLWEMVDRILLDKIDYLINKRLENFESTSLEKRRYKSSIGTKQLNCYVSIGGWEKLDYLSKLNGKSKARIVQELIMEHKSITELTEKRRIKKPEEKELKYFAGPHTKNLFLNSSGIIKHKNNIPKNRWGESEYKQYDVLKPYADNRIKAIKEYKEAQQHQ